MGTAQCGAHGLQRTPTGWPIVFVSFQRNASEIRLQDGPPAKLQVQPPTPRTCSHDSDLRLSRVGDASSQGFLDDTMAGCPHPVSAPGPLRLGTALLWPW